MPRRRSGLQPLHIAGAVAFLTVAAGAWWVFGRDKSEKMAGNPLSGEAYAGNKIPRGNTLVVTGTIQKQLRFGADSSRLFSVEVKEENSSETTPVGILVPPEFSSINIQVGQEFQFSVLVDKDGVLRAKDIKKS